MVEVTAIARPRQSDGEAPTQAASWDPLIRPLALGCFLLALIYNSAALGGIPGVVLPNSLPLLIGIACVGFALILPRDRAVVVPLGAVGVLAMAILSILWSQDEASSILWLRSQGAVTLGITAMVIVLPTSNTISVLKAYVRIVLAITMFAVTVEPLARIHIDPLGQAPPLKGWHGYFVHKNIMAAFLVFALATVLAFDKNKVSRYLSLASIAFLFVVSDSTTGRMAALVLVAVDIWFLTNQRLSGRSSAALGAATGALVAMVGVAIGASLNAIADAAGKDLTFTGRTKIWSASWNAFLRDPIIGHGVNGLFGTPRTVETASVLREIGFQAGHPHNGLLDVAVQFGAVGIVLVIAVVVSVFRSSVKLQRRSPEVAGWALCAISAIVIMSVGESVFLGSSIATMILLRTVILREATAPQRGVETSSVRRHR